MGNGFCKTQPREIIIEVTMWLLLTIGKESGLANYLRRSVWPSAASNRSRERVLRESSSLLQEHRQDSPSASSSCECTQSWCGIPFKIWLPSSAVTKWSQRCIPRTKRWLSELSLPDHPELAAILWRRGCGTFKERMPPLIRRVDQHGCRSDTLFLLKLNWGLKGWRPINVPINVAEDVARSISRILHSCRGIYVS